MRKLKAVINNKISRRRFMVSTAATSLAVGSLAVCRICANLVIL